MFQDNEQKSFRGNMKKSKKTIALLASFLLLISVAVGGTVAFLVDSTEELPNIFTPSAVTTAVIEDVTTPGFKKDVRIQNTGDTEAYIRAAVVVTWQDKDGNVYGKAPIEDTDYQIDWYEKGIENDSKSNWKKGKDGFYYWTKPVNVIREEDFTEEGPETLTGVLISSCTTKENPASTVPSGYYLNVEIIGSGIQSKPTSVVTSEWSNDAVTIDIDQDGKTLIIKDKQ